MRYQIRVAGKVFEGDDTRRLLKRAVEAKRRAAQLAPLHALRTSNTQAKHSSATG